MVSENLSRSLAKICGDGYLCQKYMRYNNTSPKLLNEFKRDMLIEFGNIHFIKGIVNSGTHFVQIQNKEIINKFLSYLKDFRSNKIKIPSEILNSNLKIKLQFVRVFYDDEGCAALRLYKNTEWKRNVTVTSNSKLILKQISQILNSLKIKTNRIVLNNRKRADDTAYALSITGKDNFLKFQKHIGFIHPRKSKMLEFIIKSYYSTPKRNPENFKKLKTEMELNVSSSTPSHV